MKKAANRAFRGKVSEPFGRCGDMEYMSGDLHSGTQTGHGTGHADAPKHIKDVDLYAKIDHPKAAKLARIKDGIHHMRWHSGLEKYPYEEDIEGLKTSLICTLNLMSELVAYLEDNDGRPRNLPPSHPETGS